MKLSEKLVKLRKEKGLSQEEFGNEINVSRQAVSKWENEESKPDIDKIQEIVKKFNVNYEYLLNDEIEEDVKEEKKESTEEKKSHKKHLALKIILVILLIYVLFCVYKFIAFYRFYLIANSFSEKNYMMWEDYVFNSELNGKFNVNHSIYKVDDKLIEKTYQNNSDELLTNEDGSLISTSIEYTDETNKVKYKLNYDEDKKMYYYTDCSNDASLTEEEAKEQFDVENKDLIRQTTLQYIPSGFKQILIASINPEYYYVSITNREYRRFSIADDAKQTVKLTNDYLIESSYLKSNYTVAVYATFSYDYVQDHFKEIKNPLESYKDMILYEE